MNKLIIQTRYPGTVTDLLKRLELVDSLPHISAETANLETVYPDDVLSQELDLWLGIAKVCGLIEDFSFVPGWRIR